MAIMPTSFKQTFYLSLGFFECTPAIKCPCKSATNAFAHELFRRHFLRLLLISSRLPSPPILCIRLSHCHELSASLAVSALAQLHSWQNEAVLHWQKKTNWATRSKLTILNLLLSFRASIP